MSNTSKPAREWAYHFPEPIRSQFLANSDDVDCLREPDRIVNSRKDALNWAFWWENAPEKYQYWYNIYQRCTELEEPIEPITENNPLFTPEQWEWVKSLSTDDEMRKRMRAFCHAMLKATEQ